MQFICIESIVFSRTFFYLMFCGCGYLYIHFVSLVSIFYGYNFWLCGFAVALHDSFIHFVCPRHALPWLSGFRSWCLSRQNTYYFPVEVTTCSAHYPYWFICCYLPRQLQKRCSDFSILFLYGGYESYYYHYCSLFLSFSLHFYWYIFVFFSMYYFLY